MNHKEEDTAKTERGEEPCLVERENARLSERSESRQLYKKHVFVCTEGKTCPNQGSKEVFDELRRLLSASDHKEGIRINKAGCLSQCGNGPMMVVYPEGTWYCQVSVDDCKEIVENHLGQNKIIERLLLK